MAATNFETKNRNVIPRWRDSQTTKLTAEIVSLGPKIAKPLDEQQFRQKLRDWEESPSIGAAAELLNAAIVLNKAMAAQSAAEYLVETKKQIPDALLRTARAILGPSSPQSKQLTFSPTFASRENIRQLRLNIRQYPRNSLAWVDLSREYASTGQLEQANHAMNIAVALAPTNRFVVRSAARLYVHLEDAGRAHEILVKAVSAHPDPWLIAAELAIAPIAKVAPEFVYEARNLLKSGNLAPIHLSEMASALATLEMSNGNKKQARKLFHQALQQPTENTVAQASWASEELGKMKTSFTVLDVPRLFEARSWGFYRIGDWSAALDQAFGWLDDQPFSSRPAIHGSYIASSLLEDYDSSERIARAGLGANPREFGLLNNLAVALAKMGRVKEGVPYFERINRSNLNSIQRVVWQATAGLLCFRNGQIEDGRRLYNRAIDNATDSEIRAQAALAWATEELCAHTPEASDAKLKAVTLAKGVSSPVMDALVTRLSKISVKAR